MENIPKEKNSEKKRQAKKTAAYMLLFEIGIEFAVILALPLIAFIYGGQWLDQKYDTKIFVVAGILLALSLSSYLVYRKIKTVKNFLK